MDTSGNAEQGGRIHLARHPVAIECSRAAAGFSGGSAEIVVFDGEHVVVAANNDGKGAFLPRPMKPAETALWSSEAGEVFVEADGVHSTAIRDRSGTLVAALTIWEHTNPVDGAATAALARMVHDVLPDDSDVIATDFHAEVLRGQRDAVLVLSPELDVRWISEGVGSLLGRTPAEVIGRSAVDFLHPEDMVQTMDAVTRISQGLEIYRVIARLSNSSGGYTPVEVTGTDMSDHPTVGGLVLSLRDAQHAREHGIAMDRARRTSESIVGGLRDGVLATDEFGAVTAINETARAMFGIDPKLTPAQLQVEQFSLVTLDGRPHDILDTESPTGTECCLVSPRGDVLYLTVACQEIADETSTLGNVVIFTDITSERRAAEELRTQALHDQLTGLANRRQLEQRLDDLAMSGQDVNVAACFVDLDAFKGVNDTHGHRAGDQLVRIAANRLERQLRSGDLLVRQGGDEFVALLVGVADLGEAAVLAERCRRVLAEPYDFDGQRFYLTTSIGVAMASTTGLDGDHLLQHADLALYAAKDNGRNRVETFDAELEAAAVNDEFQRRLLRDALDEGRIVMHFQPLIDAGTEATVGYEALVRVRTCDDEILGPGAFLDGVHGTSLMWDLDRAAFALSCEAAASFAQVAPDRLPYVACNFSSVSVNHPGFVDFLDATVASAGVEPSKIAIELTESAAFDAGKRGLAALVAVADRGFRVALDDFGTGYSSLSHIRDLPITEIKVDRSFIVRLGVGCSERSIAEAVVRIADDLEIGVVAEGVETFEQLEQARSIGFSTIQGWYYSRAVPLAECLDPWETGQSDSVLSGPR